MYTVSPDYRLSCWVSILGAVFQGSHTSP